MPVQTTQDAYIYFPDGAQVSVKESGAGTFTDIGVLNSAITLTFNFDENQVDTANGGKTAKQIKNMTVDGSFDLANLDPENIERLGASLFTRTATAGTSVSSIDNQVIASGAASDLTAYNLVITETGGANLKVSSALVITSVTGSTNGALAANDDYNIVTDTNSPSGRSIVFDITGGTTLTTMAQTFTIVYTSVTPVASNTITVGQSTATLTSYEIKFTHTDDDSVIDREVEVFAAEPNSGGFQFNFLGANEDGIEIMPISFTGRIDTALSSGAQLMSIYQTIKT